MVAYDVVILGLSGNLVLYVMYRWSMLLGNGSYDLFPGSLNIAINDVIYAVSGNGLSVSFPGRFCLRY